MTFMMMEKITKISSKINRKQKKYRQIILKVYIDVYIILSNIDYYYFNNFNNKYIIK